jgi:hypothetical protein
LTVLQVETPIRKKHSYVQRLHGNPDVVFRLLCPVLEVEWVPGWMPITILSNSGVAEPDCMFVTPADPHDAIWIVSKHDPENLCLEMYKVTPKHTVAKLEASLSALDDDATEAVISYEFTAIGPSGEDFLSEFTVDWYETFMVDWEGAMNRYLAEHG